MEEVAAESGQRDRRGVAEHVQVQERGEVLAQRVGSVDGQEPGAGHREHHVAKPANLPQAEPERQPDQRGGFHCPGDADPDAIELHGHRDRGEDGGPHRSYGDGHPLPGRQRLAEAVEEVAGERWHDDPCGVGEHVQVQEGGEVLVQRVGSVDGQQPRGGDREDHVAEPPKLPQAERKGQPDQRGRFDAPGHAYPGVVELQGNGDGGEDRCPYRCHGDGHPLPRLDRLAEAVEEVAGKGRQDDGPGVAEHVQVQEGSKVVPERARSLNPQQPHGRHDEDQVAKQAEFAQAEPDREPHQGNRLDPPDQADPGPLELEGNRKRSEARRQRRHARPQAAQPFSPQQAAGHQERVEHRQQCSEAPHPGAMVGVQERVADEPVRDGVHRHQDQVENACRLPPDEVERDCGPGEDEEYPGDPDLGQRSRGVQLLHPKPEKDE